MSRIEDEIDKIADPVLRAALLDSVKKLKTEKKFGLVFEEHLPELVPVYNVPVKARSMVARRGRTLSETFRVVRVQDGIADVEKNDGSRKSIPVEELTIVRRFGEPIYPALRHFDRVKNGDTSQPHHILIEADNYHALQLLEYCYSGQVDCIYIDPPYNTGAKDWKYNNDYVDGNDTWRHSKWLSMMSKRLELAKRLLKPDIGVLIVTIDEHEIYHLGMLLEKLFPDSYRQMVTIVINPKGVTQGRFSRVEEHALFCFMKGAMISGVEDDLLTSSKNQTKTKKPRWKGLLRSGTGARRADRKSMFYPIIIDPQTRSILGAGEPLPFEEQPDFDLKINGFPVAWPVRSDGSLGRWSVGAETLRELVRKGYISLGVYDEQRQTYGIVYLSKVLQKQIDAGTIVITTFDKIRNTVEVEYAEARTRAIKTVWHRTLHDAGAYGSDFISNIFGETGRFSFPKSFYSVRDTISAIVRDRPSAIVIDFFAGSGTTLNAVNLLNTTDNGNRQCVLVTNNEVSESEAQELIAQGHQNGSEEWNKFGICQHVTFPRSKYTILGRRDDGSEIEGEYLSGRTVTKEKPRVFKQLGFVEGHLLTLVQRKQLVALVDKVPQSKITANMAFFVDDEIPVSILFDIQQADAWLESLEDQTHITDFYIATQENKAFNSIKQQVQELLGPVLVEEEETRPLKDGFPANLEYFKMDFLDPSEVQMGRQFAAILPILWMMAGARGPLPEAPDPHAPWLIPADCPFAVLIQERRFKDFHRHIEGRNDLSHVFIITNSCDTFQNLREEVEVPHVMQLYKDYLENFKINLERIRI